MEDLLGDDEAYGLLIYTMKFSTLGDLVPKLLLPSLYLILLDQSLILFFLFT